MGVFDVLGQALYEDVVGRKDTHIEEFSLLNAWKFLIEVAMEDHRVAMCIIKAVRKGERYEIMQMMLTKKMEPIKKNGELVIGRTIYAYTLDDDMVDYLAGKDSAVMSLETLRRTEDRK